MTMEHQDTQVRAGNALGVFLVALSTLMLEITLTRIFSVTLWYHFGALAVSLAMFGIGASGVFVYVLPGLFRREALGRQLSVLCTLFAISIAICFYIQLRIPFVPVLSLASLARLTLLYAITAVPFFMSGLCISVIFTHLPSQIGKLYFMDLLGAGLGCLFAVLAMSVLSAPNVVLVSATLAGIGGVSFAYAAGKAPVRRSVVLCIVLAALLPLNIHANLFRLEFVKGETYKQPEYERWNAYAYIGIWGALAKKRPFGWGMSKTWNGTTPRERLIRIDAGAATVITEFKGDLDEVDHLTYDVTSIGHYLFQDHSVLIIGAGGGRDILAALALGAGSVSGLEYNASIVEAVSDRYAEFSGQVYDLPGVKKIIAEGRSYIHSSADSFDLIQAALVDSWAASASGAFVMAENFLYTKEAFAAFLDRLTDDGVLSITRFNIPQAPQVLRTVSIAIEVLQDRGISRPQDHVMVITADRAGTVLVGKRPFTATQIQTIEREAQRLRFGVAWLPGKRPVGDLGALLSAEDPGRFISEFVYDISPPTDDRPFFFHMATTPKALRQSLMTAGVVKMGKFNVKWYGPLVLLAVLLVTTVLAVLCILVPLHLRRADVRGITGKGVSIGYFACLGIGFMLVEIPLMQRLTLLLGHPVYALSVVLFALLVFAGCGSLISSRMQAASAESCLRGILLLLIAVLCLYNFLVPTFVSRFIALRTGGRIALAVATLLPVGLLLGMPLPLGMRVLAARAPRLIPWVWGVNGACSVFASLFALALAMTVGFTWTMAVGTAVYLLALILTLRPSFRARPLTPVTEP